MPPYTKLNAQINELKQQHLALANWLQTYQEYIEELQQQINILEAEVRITIETQADKIAELECLADPYSQNGTPICHFSYETEI